MWPGASTGSRGMPDGAVSGDRGLQHGKGRYNIVSTRGLAGGLAAVLPERQRCEAKLRDSICLVRRNVCPGRSRRDCFCNKIRGT
ncbi:MAG: hypothetical protein ACLUD2_13285 [Clostridium sp.]